METFVPPCLGFQHIFTKVLVRIALYLLLGLCSLEMMLRRMKQFSSKTAHACTYRKATTTTQVLQSSQESPIGQNDDGNWDRWLYHKAIGPYCKYIYCVYYKYINTILKCLQLFPALYDMICSKYLLHLHLFTEWFQENDLLVVDRGSRNLVEFLEEGEYRVQIIKTAH